MGFYVKYNGRGGSEDRELPTTWHSCEIYTIIFICNSVYHGHANTAQHFNSLIVNAVEQSNTISANISDGTEN